MEDRFLQTHLFYLQDVLRNLDLEVYPLWSCCHTFEVRIKLREAIYQLGKTIISGDLSISKLAKAGLHGLIDDFVYLQKNANVPFKLFKTYSNKKVYRYGYHLGRATLDIASAIVGGKLATTFSKTKLGRKIVSKVKKTKVKTKNVAQKVRRKTGKGTTEVGGNLYLKRTCNTLLKKLDFLPLRKQ